MNKRDEYVVDISGPAPELHLVSFSEMVPLLSDLGLAKGTRFELSGSIKRLDTLARDLGPRTKFVFPSDVSCFTINDVVRVLTSGEAFLVESVDQRHGRLRVRRGIGARKSSGAREGTELLIVGSASEAGSVTR